MSYTIQKHEETRQNSLIVTKGGLAVIWGIAAIICSMIAPVPLIKTFGILNIVAALLTFSYAYANRHLRISHQWLLLEGAVELGAGIVFLFIVNDMRLFNEYMGFGILFVVILQFIYGYSLLLTNVVHPKNMIMRFLSVLVGVVIGVGLVSGFFGPITSFVSIGLFSVIYGVLNIQFAMKLRNIVMGEAN